MLAIIPAAVFVIVAFAQVLSGGDSGDIIGESLVATITATLHVCFWTTLVFAIMERTNTDTGLTWDVDQLPEPREEHPRRADLIATLIFLGLVLVALLWDQIPGFIRLNDEPVAILNPELWPWGMLGLLAIVGLEIVFAIVLYLRRRWTVTLAVVNTVLSVLLFSWVITLLVRGELFSAEFLDLAILNITSADIRYTLAVIFGFSVGIVCLWEVIDGWVKTYQDTRSQTAQQQPATAE